MLERGQANGIIGLKLLDKAQALEIEPHCGGVGWLHVPGTGITDYVAVCQKYAELIVAQGGTVSTGTEVTSIARGNGETVLETSRGSLSTKYVINCAGLHSDRVSRMAGEKTEVTIVPFRGEYYDLTQSENIWFAACSIPCPISVFRFSACILRGGSVAGWMPDRTPCWHSSEKVIDEPISASRTRPPPSHIPASGIWLANTGAAASGEFYRSFHKPAFVRALQTLVPDVRSADLVADGAGVRATAVSRDGSLVDDFQFLCSQNMLHVWNVVSPAATASLPIGREILQMAQRGFGLEQWLN